MHTIGVIHDSTGHTLTSWLGDPESEHICEETTDEVILMKNSAGGVIGIELLHYRPTSDSAELAVETIVRS